jgi:hypothetical protein
MDELAQSQERELRALMTAGLDGDAKAYHHLLERLVAVHRPAGVGVTSPRGEQRVNTERLIDVLSANLEPVSHRRVEKRLILAIVTGGAAAFVVMLATVGLRPHLQSTAHLEWSVVKLLFALSVISIGTPPLIRSMRPGLENGTRWAVVLFPFVAAMVVAFVMLALGRAQAWRGMLLGASTRSPAHCLLCIVFFSAIPLAALIWALRESAPTRLKVCGAIAGLVAGGLGAAAYALTCT